MKKLLAILSAVVLLCTAVPLGALPALSVSAETTSGTTGDCAWTLDGTHLTISGEGAMGNYDVWYPTSPWDQSITAVTIEDGVTTIGEYAFYDCDSLTSVTIGNSVAIIGENAFYKCASLTSVTIGDSVTTIGEYAFYDCDSLTSVTIPDSVTTIGDKAFLYCDSLASIEVDENNSSYCSVDSVLFNKSQTLLIHYPAGKSGAYTIPNSVTTIGNTAFYSCTALTSVTIPNSVTTIGNEAFCYCDSLTSVTIGDSVITIGDYAFHKCTSLTSVAIPDSVTTIGECAFYDCNRLTSATIGDSVITIGDYAFSSCSSLTSIEVDKNNPNYCSVDGVLFDKSQTLLIQYLGGKYGAYTIPDSVTTIGDWAFSSCRSLTSVTIPDSVATIGEYAFHYCTSLRTVTIGDSVTTIGDWAFSSCRSLTSVTIPDSVTTIGNEAFYYCDSLTSVTIGDGVTTIGDEAFYYCDSLTSVTIGNGVTTIGDEAFENCTSLESVHITDVAAWCGIDFGYSDANPLYYGDLYLDGTLVTDLVIPDGVTSIGYYAFRYCDSLTTVTIPDSVTSIGESAFRYCDSLTDVYYTGTEEDHAFIKIGSSNTPLLNATWHYNSCIHVYDHACDVDCNLCGAIREVPGHVYDYVGDMDCNACGAIREEVSGTTGDCTWTLDADGHLTISGNGVMADYDSWDNPAPWDQFITAVTIEDGVTAIGEDAFYNCDSLTSVTIPDSVTTVGTYAFYNCDSLTSVTIPDSVITIGDCAFSSCRSLTSIEVDNNNPNYCSVDGVLFDKSQTLLIQYPGGKSGAYTIPDSVTTIGNAAFSYCISLTSVTIPDSVTTIGSFAFSVRSSLTDVYYSGTEEDRALIEIGFANDPLLNATWHYNYVPTPVCDHVYDDDTDPDCNACGDLRWAVSADIDFIISGADSGVALPAGTEVSVEQVAVGTVTPDLGDTAQIVTVYDITLTVNGVSIQPDGMMAVTLPIPTDAARYTDLQVVYIDDAGNVTPCETVVNKDGTITFYTDHFSYYAIVGTPAVLCGDANGDGTVNNRDVALLQQHINGWDVTLDETAADANGDGSVNNRDVALLQQYINGWDVTLGE